MASPTASQARPTTAGAAERIAGLRSFTGRFRVLHLTWIAFFLTFMVWFGFAPFAGVIGKEFGLGKAELGTLALVNVALTVPARVAIGMALDRWGPRRVYGFILVFSAVPSLMFATAHSFAALLVSRLLLSVIGAGFVVGIRLVAEWFPPAEVGFAEGVYGGWGNAGAAASALLLPAAADLLSGPAGWRWATGATGVITALYGLYYLRAVTDTPSGRTYRTPKRQGALVVGTRGGVVGLVALTVPVTAILGLIVWRIQRIGMLHDTSLIALGFALTALLVVQVRRAIVVNRPALNGTARRTDAWPVRSLGVLSLAYACSFGSELAVVSILPTFFADTWRLSPAVAGVAASAFALTNLVARPAGGLLSDLLGSRRRTLGALLAGLAGGYGLMAVLGSGAVPIAVALVVVVACSLFVQSTNGAVFAVVPLVRPEASGQVAGMTGAYGNIGALVFLTVFLFVPTTTFFLVIAAASLVATVAVRWLVEPADSFATHHVEVEVEVEPGARPRPAPHLDRGVAVDVVGAVGS